MLGTTSRARSASWLFVAIAALTTACMSGEPNNQGHAPIYDPLPDPDPLANGELALVADPVALQLPGYEDIFWQKVTLSQGSCPVELSAIFYWSPANATQSRGDEFYTPTIFVHGGGWAGAAHYNAPTDPDDAGHLAQAAGIANLTSRGFMYVLPTYRGAAELAADPSIGIDCEHSMEVLSDAEFLVAAVHLRHAQIPNVIKIRTGQKIRLSGGSAGGHVAMGIAVRHPDWFDRVMTGIGIYDLQDWLRNWDQYWATFGDRNLAECDLQYDSRVQATSNYYKPPGGYHSMAVVQQNCAKVPVLDEAGRYRVTDYNDPSKWVEVSGGIFFDAEIETGGTRVMFFDGSFLGGLPAASSRADGAWPTMNRVVIRELDAESVPVVDHEIAREAFVASLRGLADSLISGLFNQPFLEMDPDDPVLAAHAFGKLVRNGTGEYPSFRLGTNTGDFVLQEQQLSFCNDMQATDGLLPNQLLSSHAKGKVYQCGDRGSLYIGVGGTHLSGTPYAVAQGAVNFEWFVTDIDPRHSTKSTTCSYSEGSQTAWLEIDGGVRVYLDGVAISTPIVDDQLFATAWDAIIGDPLYFGHAPSNITRMTSDSQIVIERGELQMDGGSSGRYYEICERAL